MAIPDTSGNNPTSPSLTIIVKRQVAAVAFFSMDFFPLLYNQHSPSSSSPSLTSDLALRRQVEAKLADGDVTGAVCLASSNDTLAPFDGETLSGLWSKHPPMIPIDNKITNFPLIVNRVNIENSHHVLLECTNVINSENCKRAPMPENTTTKRPRTSPTLQTPQRSAKRACRYVVCGKIFNQSQ